MRLAVFDFDGTLLRGNSWQIFLWWSFARWPTRSPFVFMALAARQARLLTGARLRDVALRPLRGLDAAAVGELGDSVFRSRLRRRLRLAARREVAAARANGMVPVIATSAFDFLVAPVAVDLGVKDVISTKLAYTNGVCLGCTLKPEPRAEQKAAALRRHFASRDIDWERSTAFSDELEDLPLLMCVGQGTLVGWRGPRPSNLSSTIQIVDWEASS
jgi:HAD superfamily hydrolase (TIGR01490 family)